MDILEAFKTTAKAKKDTGPDPKEEWWDGLTLKEQKLYMDAHPNSSKHLRPHNEMHSYHNSEAAKNEDVLDYQTQKLGEYRDKKRKRRVNPETVQKAIGKADDAEDAMYHHLERAAYHKSKMEEEPESDDVPEYGDENGEKEEVEEGHNKPLEDNNEHINEADKEIDDKKKGIHESIKSKQEETPHKKKIARAIDKVKKYISKPESDKAIANKVSDIIKKDPQSKKALEEASKYADAKMKPPKHVLKKLGKIAAIGLAAAITVSVAGAMPTIMLAAVINSTVNHGKGLGDLAWDAYQKGREARKNKPTSEELHYNHLKFMIEGMRKVFNDTKNEEEKDRIAHLIDELKDTLDKHSMYALGEDTDYYNDDKEEKPKHHRKHHTHH